MAASTAGCARYNSHGSIALFVFHADAGGGAYFMVLRFLSNQLQAAGAAFQLITRIPIPIMIPFVPQVLARSVVYYPLVGTVVGGITAAVGWFLFAYAPAMPAAVSSVILWALLSGALHLDGLMDTADGVLSHRSRDRMLEIMKDSRVGAMGVIAAVFCAALQILCSVQLVRTGDLASYGCVHCCCLRAGAGSGSYGRWPDGLLPDQGKAWLRCSRCPRKACGRCNDDTDYSIDLDRYCLWFNMGRYAESVSGTSRSYGHYGVGCLQLA